MPGANDLVELADVHAGLHLTEGDFDTKLDLLISGCSQTIIEYLKDLPTDWMNTAGIDRALVPKNVKQATIMLVGYHMREADADEANAFADGTLPGPVKSMLVALRIPTVA